MDPGIYCASELSQLGGKPIKSEMTIELLDIKFHVPPSDMLQMISPATETFWASRKNVWPCGLNRFCPTLSFVYPSDVWYDCFIDLYVREKDSPLGESYSHLTGFLGNTQIGDYGLRAKTNESYHDAADFYEKNFAAAEAGEDPKFSNFVRLEDETISGAVFRHYSFDNDYSVGRSASIKQTSWVASEGFAEHYLFETDKYIYVFAFSGAYRSEDYFQLFRDIVHGVEIKTDGGFPPPVWEHCQWMQEEMTGPVPELLDYLKERRNDIKGDLPECVSRLLEE